jgi:hypothetical protein
VNRVERFDCRKPITAGSADQEMALNDGLQCCGAELPQGVAFKGGRPDVFFD